MFFIQTNRLRLIPLSYDQLQALSVSRQKLEKLLGLSISDFKLNAPDSFLEEFNDVIQHIFLQKVTENPQAYLWYTHWIIVENESNLTIGGMGARGETDANGENMIGYFIDQKSEGKGYATEAVIHFCEWMFQQDRALKTVLADTLADGLGSQRVLQKAGFIFDSAVEEGLRWRLKPKE
jgi:[ribosomal protein S5]-alanine N-acetyltransferase